MKNPIWRFWLDALSPAARLPDCPSSFPPHRNHLLPNRKPLQLTLMILGVTRATSTWMWRPTEFAAADYWWTCDLADVLVLQTAATVFRLPSLPSWWTSGVSGLTKRALLDKDDFNLNIRKMWINIITIFYNTVLKTALYLIRLFHGSCIYFWRRKIVIK